MRLIDTETGEFVEFVDLSKIPPYAILSHTWEPAPVGEQSYQDVVKIQEKYRHCPPPEEETFFDSRSDGLERVPRVLAASEIGTPAQSTLPMSREQPRSYSIFLGLQPLWCALVLSIVRVWLSRLLDPPTPLEPERHNDIKTPRTPPVRRSIWDPDSGLSKKVRRACEIARRDGYRYIWIDCSCIDKASSSELSEAINSMYNWYRGAQVCYAFLADVPSDEDVRAEGSRFRTSRWFTRGWTLQELIAPLVVVFLSQDWEGLGTKDALADLIQDITFIDRGILTREKVLSDESVAERMRWASTRTTTRVEDEAYSLLGIFGITMPTLYGEGRYAFRRLQEEIMQRIPDQSLFAWGSVCLPIPQEPFTISVGFTDSGTPFAPSPHSFASSRGRTIRATGYSVESLGLPVEEYTHTPYGIRTQLYLLPLQALNAKLDTNGFGSATVPWYLVVLGSQHADDQSRLLSRLCYLRRDKTNVEFLYVPDWIALPRPPGELELDRRNALIFTLSLDDLARVRETQLQTKTVYLPHPKPSVAERQLEGENNALNLILPTWARAALRMRGYAISNVQGPTQHHRNSSSLTLFHASFNIHIHYRHMLIHRRWYDDAVVIEARVWILSPTADGALRSDATIQCSPPYTSATWADGVPSAMTLPSRSVNLVADSGDEVTLRLGLDLTAPSRYNVRVEVAPAGTAGVGASLRPDFKDLPKVLDAPHETFKLTLPGSVRRALGMKGYSARLELGPNLGGFHSHSLTVSSGADSGFAVVVKYLHTLGNDSPLRDSQALVVVARVTLESSIPDDGSETYQDGPYVVIWRDMLHTWQWSLEEKHVVLATPTGKSLTLHLGFDFAWQSEYYLHIDIEPGTSRFRPPELWHGRHGEYPYSLDGVHESVSLTLPGHVKRALQTQGYQVLFEGLDGDDEGNPARHRLTLSKVNAGFVIVIDYSHNLTTDSGEQDSGPSADSEPGSGLPIDSKSEGASTDSESDSLLIDSKARRRPQQELTFQARVKVLPSRGFQADTQVAVQSDGTTMDWNARHPRVGVWRRHLSRKDITLTLPTGRWLTLRLGFYLVWYSEYCLMVEINPRTPLSRTPSRPDVPPVSPHDSFEFEASTMQMPVLWPWTRPRPLGHWSAGADDGLFLPDPGTLTPPETTPFQSGEHAEMQGIGDSEDGESVTSLGEGA